MADWVVVLACVLALLAALPLYRLAVLAEQMENRTLRCAVNTTAFAIMLLMIAVSMCDLAVPSAGAASPLAFPRQ